MLALRVPALLESSSEVEMLVAEAFVSGSLGQAVFRDDSALRILDAPDAEPREASPNEIYWFRHAAREVAAAHPEGFPVQIETVRARLDEEIQFFRGLDGLLVGMDRDFSPATRRRAIGRAEAVLSANDAIARRIRERFLIPANTEEWDPAGGLALALERSAEAAARCYQPLENGIIDRLADDIAAVVLEKFGSGLDAARKRETILRSGILAELALIETQADRAALSRLLFRRSEFPKLQAVDPSGQILTALIQSIEQGVQSALTNELIDRAAPPTGETAEAEGFEPSDPIIAAVERAVAHYESGRPPKGGFADLPGIKREIAWVGERLKRDETTRAEKAVVELIDRRSQRDRREDIVKTLTAIAGLARDVGLFEWTWRLLAAVDHLGVPDAAALCVRAETLRDLGRYDEALAVFEETKRCFPDCEVAPTAYAETLRDLGRSEEALAAFEETKRRFPDSEVAPTAYAETLRDLGRSEEALAAFEETMRRFPHNEVAPTAHAETLRDLGRSEEALAALKETMRRFPHSEVAPTAYAETLRDLGRSEEALAALKETKRRFPHSEVAPTAYAETLRDLGRSDEALAAFEETMRRFPRNAVAPNAYAETLRDLGRYDEALASFEETMCRFPHNEVTPRAYAHLLAERGRYAEAEALLAPAAERLRNGGDWIAAHILAMARLRAGHTKKALTELEHGARSCPFRDQRRFFITALPLALLADRRAPEAVRQLEAIANDPNLPSVEAANILLLRVHALAEAGEKPRAQTLAESARIIEFAAARQNRLASALTERYGLVAGSLPSDMRAQQLSEDIATLEFELVRPKLWSFRANIRRAA